MENKNKILQNLVLKIINSIYMLYCAFFASGPKALCIFLLLRGLAGQAHTRPARGTLASAATAQHILALDPIRSSRPSGSLAHCTLPRPVAKTARGPALSNSFPRAQAVIQAWAGVSSSCTGQKSARTISSVELDPTAVRVPQCNKKPPAAGITPKP
jgi:hypothetical protein